LGLENNKLDRALPDMAEHIWCELDSWEVISKSIQRKKTENGEKLKKKGIRCGLLWCGANQEIGGLSGVHLVHLFTGTLVLEDHGTMKGRVIRSSTETVFYPPIIMLV
jgi:hypothetical protein